MAKSSNRRARPRPILHPHPRDAESIRSDLLVAQQRLAELQPLPSAADAYAICKALVDRLSSLTAALLPQKAEIEIEEKLPGLLVNGQPLVLTSQEFIVVLALASKRPHFTPGHELTPYLYGEKRQDGTSVHVVSVLVSSMRRKLTQATGRKDLIRAVLGRGYRIDDTVHKIYPPTSPAEWNIDPNRVSELLSSYGRHRPGTPS